MGAFQKTLIGKNRSISVQVLNIYNFCKKCLVYVARFYPCMRRTHKMPRLLIKQLHATTNLVFLSTSAHDKLIQLDAVHSLRWELDSILWTWQQIWTSEIRTIPIQSLLLFTPVYTNSTRQLLKVCSVYVLEGFALRSYSWLEGWHHTFAVRR